MKALLLIDLQIDFLPGGALAVPRGDQVISVANRRMPDYSCVVATQDWHPADHKSFASQHPGHRVGDIVEVDGIEQILWPDHCVQGTRGAEFAPGLNVASIRRVVRKGIDPNLDSYSGFFDNARRGSTELKNYLRSRGMDEVDVMGLATDYCVKSTVLDALDLGFRTTVIAEGIRAVNLYEGDQQRALDQMRAAGATIA